MTAVHVFRTMGTVASLRTPAPASSAVLGRIEAIHEEYDRTFSRYRPESPASLLARGDATPEEAGPVVEAALERSIRWRAATHGAFTPYAADGSVDLMGIAKALAMEEAEQVLDAELPGWVLNVGGDMAWHAWGDLQGRLVGVADPADPQEVLCTVPLDAGWTAAATSGTSERGEHIRRSGRTAEFRQATVLAGDVVTADVLATAVVAGGQDVLLEAAARPGVDVLAVTVRGEAVFTDGLADHVVGAWRGRRAGGRH
jgi:thiamine biosynthesis lipoprotein